MKRTELFFTLILVPLDFAALMGAGLLAYMSRFHPAFVKVRPVIFDLSLETFTHIEVPVALLTILIFALAGLYTTHRRALASEMLRVILATSAGMAALFAILFFSRFFFESRFIAIAAWAFSILLVVVARLMVRTLQRILLSVGVGMHRVVVIGETTTAARLLKLFEQKPRLGFRVVAHLPLFDEKTKTQLLLLKQQGGIDDVILADPEAPREVAMKILAFTDAEQMTFHYRADLFAAAVGRTVIHTLAGVPVIEVRKTPLDGWGAIFKRTFDILGAIILITLTLPIQLTVAVALLIEQPGRILFSRLPNGSKTQRIGKNGSPFHYFKFRSMIKDAHQYRFDPTFVKKYGNLREGTPLFKLKEDPRVTPVGRLIRRWSMDELPEFFLVLLGRMSLVGPRPHLPEEVKQYTSEQCRVFTVRPGITGLAQISGRADLDFKDEVRLDVHYIEHWSPWLDLYILFKTPLTVLFRKGAY